MKKEKIINVPAVKAHTKTVSLFICDICGSESKDRISKCTCCGRDICGGNLLKKGCRMLDPHEFGDYPDPYCSICYNLRFEKYAKEFSNLEEIYYHKQDSLWEKIKKESLSSEEVKE